MKKLQPFFDILGEILAILLVLTFLVSVADATFHFITDATVLAVLTAIRTYGALALVAVVGMEAMCKCGFVLRVIFYVAVAIIVIFMFFPGTYNYLIGLIPQA